MFTATKKRRNARRCHMFTPTTLPCMISNRQANHDIYIISTSQVTDAIRCYRFLCPRYLRQDVSKFRNKQTPRDLFNFDNKHKFSFDLLVRELQQLDGFFCSREPSVPNITFYANTTWQDVFLLFEIFATSLFINSSPISGPASETTPTALVKIVDATKYVLQPNGGYNEYEICNLLNIYNFNILVTFMVWYLLYDKRNISFSSAWQPSLLNFVVYDLWAALAKQNRHMSDVLSRLFFDIKSFGQIQISCSREMHKQLALGPYRCVQTDRKPAHKRLQHTYKQGLSRVKLTNFAVNTSRIPRWQNVFSFVETDYYAQPQLMPAEAVTPPNIVDYPTIVSTPPPPPIDFYSLDNQDDDMFWTTHDMENFELEAPLLTPPHV